MSRFEVGKACATWVRRGRRRYWCRWLPILLIGVGAPLAAAIPGLELIPDGPSGPCRLVLSPQAFAGSDRAQRLVFTPTVAGGLGITLDTPSGLTAVQAVARDRRFAFRPVLLDAAAGGLTALPQAAPWLPILEGGPLHVTARTPSGGVATARFEGLDLLAVLAQVQAGCGITLAADSEPETCAARVLAAHQDGLRGIAAQTRRCTGERDAVADRLVICRAAAPGVSVDAIEQRLAALWARQFPQVRIRVTGADAVAALGAVEQAMRLAAAATQAERLATEQAGLRAAVAAAREGERVTVLPPEALRRLVLAILAPTRCDSVRLEFDDHGGFAVAGVVASAQTEAAMGAAVARLRRTIGAGSLALKVLPAGTCAVALEGGWRVIPDADGKLSLLPFRAELRTMAGLPTPAALPALDRLVRKHEALGAYFGNGRTPWLWCRSDGALGICKRDAYSGAWSFQPDPGRTQAGFLMLGKDDK